MAPLWAWAAWDCGGVAGRIVFYGGPSLRGGRGSVCRGAYGEAQRRGNSGFYGAYPLTRDWSDTTVSWNSPWTTPGGDFAASPDATAPKQGVAGVWYHWNVTSRVQACLSGTAVNHGWLIKCADENLHNQDRLYQSDTVNADNRPKLVISDVVDAVPGDISGGGAVDVADLLYFVDSFAAMCGTDRNYDPRCDFNTDQIVDVVDLLTFVEYWPQP